MSEQNREAELDLTFILDFLLRRRWLIAAVTLVVFTLTALATYSARPVYETASMIIIEKERGSGAVYNNGSMVESRNDDYYQTQYKMLQSFSLNQRVYDQLHLESTDEFAQPHGVEKLIRATSVVPVFRSRLVYVKAASFDPKRAAAIANAVSETFVAENLSNQMFISKDVLQTLQVSQNSRNARQLYESLPQVVARIRAGIDKIQSDGIPEDEFEKAKAKLVVSHAMRNTTPAERAFEASLDELYGLRRYLPRPGNDIPYVPAARLHSRHRGDRRSGRQAGGYGFPAEAIRVRHQSAVHCGPQRIADGIRREMEGEFAFH